VAIKRAEQRPFVMEGFSGVLPTGDAHRYARDAGGDMPDHSGMKHVRMNHVKPLTAHQFNQSGYERRQVAPLPPREVKISGTALF
jgi:hypothetical protein